MVLQGYMDESYDEDGVFVVAGYISTAERWAAFSREWEEALLHAVRGKNGKYRFKMSEMAAQPERLARVSVFHDIIQRHAIMGVSFTFDKRDFDRALSRLSVDNLESILWEDGLQPYFVSTKLFLEQFHKLRLTSPELAELEGPVDFYFDEHSQKKTVIGAWERFLQSRPEEEMEIYGPTPRFESDDDFLPIQAADFLAWWARKWANELGVRRGHEGKYYGFVRSAHEIPHVWLSVDEELLAQILKSWITSGLKEQGLPTDFFLVRDNSAPPKVKARENSVDPPFPVEVAFNAFKRWMQSLFSRGSAS
jgi:hypothetical protein